MSKDKGELLETKDHAEKEDSPVPVASIAPSPLTAKTELPSSDGEKESSSSLYRIDSGLLPFPEKLMALLDGNQVSGELSNGLLNNGLLTSSPLDRFHVVVTRRRFLLSDSGRLC